MTSPAITVYVDCGGPAFLVDGYRFEFNEWSGPVLIGEDGEITDGCPSGHHWRFWRAFKKWQKWSQAQRDRVQVHQTDTGWVYSESGRKA